MTELIFLGHIISKDGIKPDPKKINAITNMPIPTNKTELQRFLGMINYLEKFVPNLSQVISPLRILPQNNIVYNIEQPQIDAINQLKELITSSCGRMV